MSIWRLTALGIATLLLTFAGSISPNVVSAQQTSVCATGGAVPNPDANQGLVSDCETLLAARDTLAGTVALNWAANTPMLEWAGVSYQGTPERVTRLELWLWGLTGEIPAELGNLSNLETLNLSGNQLAGDIPTELGSLSNLETLVLSDNQLTGEIPTELGSLSNLETLDLVGNQLTGEIPTELGSLSNLERLGLSGNQLTGEIPHSLTGLTLLAGFVFHNNSGLCAPVDEAFQTWLQSVSTVRGSSCAPMDSAEDRAALVELYNATGGASWTNNTNWLSDRPIREWYGVSNDPDGRVSQLWLYNNQLTGEIPTELGSLSNLEWLGLSRNQLTGEIPRELGSLSNLERLTLSRNQLTGEIPAELGNLSNLERLWLYDNQLTGEIPAELGNLSNLETLWLHGNQLTGEIPHSLTGLTLLAGFDFHNNSGLCAPVDEAFQTWLQSVSTVRGSSCAPMDSAEDRAALVELYNATGGASWTNNTNWLSDRPIREWYGVSTDPDGRVSELFLSGNQLTGEIPTELGSLSNLETLSLGGNQLTGEIPTELGNFSNLETLDLGGNQLTGEIPTELGNFSNLETLNLGGNQLTGEIPTELGSLSNLETLDLGGNQLTGDIPMELGNLSNLERLDLSSNQLTGEIPHSLTGLTLLAWFTFHNNSGLCAPVDEAFQTWLQSVSTVRGSSCAPMDSAEDRAALVELYNATGGASWTNNTNWLSDRPIREWYGVSNDPDGRVSQLWLYNNKLTGEIPTELGSLSNLEWLGLSRNQLTGEIPRELGSLSNLERLTLSRNQLTGEIPAELGNLSNLERLWLYDNQLTGEIPAELGNLSNLQGLYLYDNQLTGEIPAELGNLSNLAWLYLSGNQLTGCVPAGLWDVPNNDFDQLGMPFCELESPGVPSVSFATPVTPLVRINSPIAVTVTFSESIFGFTIEDVGVVNGAASNFEGSDGDTVYTFDVTPNAIGPVTVDIAAGVAQDADSHENAEAVQLSLGIPYDDDHDGAIGSAEVLQAVRDYFAQKITGSEVLEVVRLYFSK